MKVMVLKLCISAVPLISFSHARTHTHFYQAVKGCANTVVSPAAQDDPSGASEATNAEGTQQAV